MFDTKVINLFGEKVELNDNKGQLEKDFIIPPFSVFDTKQGYWQDRKRLWKNIGIKSELGRGDNLTFGLNCFDYEDEKLRIEMNKLGKCLPKTFDEEKYGKKMESNQTSIFDPVLCEIMYKWFNVKKGLIYDCFAGGSVRGIVAEMLGYKYTGIDLSNKQIEANKINAQEIGIHPTWYCDDSKNVDKYLKDNSVDMIFSCPPYYDLEIYSDDKNDLSNMEWQEFRQAYYEIITKACNKLKNDRFAIFVVGDMRDKDGYYRNFVDYTKWCFNKNGLKTYNEIILLNALGTSMLRCKAPFNANRKLTKVHQNIVIFYKGDVKNIKNNYGLLLDETDII